MYRIKSLRGTIFCPPIKYTKQFVETLALTLEGYLPVLIRDSNALPILPMWQMLSPDEKDVLAFNGEKIDWVKTVEADVDKEQIVTFCERCKVIFGKILEATGFVSNRIAFAPSVIVTENEERPAVLYNKLFNVKEFGQTQLDTSNVSQVYRLEKTLGGNPRIINFVANFKAENELITTANGNQLRMRYMCDFDVNTMPRPDYKFSISDVNEFFGMAPASFAEFYNAYFE